MASSSNLWVAALNDPQDGFWQSLSKELVKCLSSDARFVVQDGVAAFSNLSVADEDFLHAFAKATDSPLSASNSDLRLAEAKTALSASIWAAALPEIARVFHQSGGDALEKQLGVILDRASSRLTALSSKNGLNLSGLDRNDVNIRKRTHPYSNFFALDEFHLTHKRFDGSESGEMERAVFLTCDAVLVLPYDPVRDHVLLVEQFRAGPMARHDLNPWQLEPIAGRIDAGETAQTAARREALEEAGLTLDRLEKIAECYPSPGTSTEFYVIYTALCDLPPDTVGQHGLLAENEDIQTHVIPFETLDAYASEHRISNLPLLTAIHWLGRHRARLSA